MNGKRVRILESLSNLKNIPMTLSIGYTCKSVAIILHIASTAGISWPQSPPNSLTKVCLWEASGQNSLRKVYVRQVPSSNFLTQAFLIKHCIKSIPNIACTSCTWWPQSPSATSVASHIQFSFPEFNKTATKNQNKQQCGNNTLQRCALIR